MPNYVYLILDTTGPSNPSIVIEGGATYATQQLVNLTLGTTDNPTTNYQMKIWGDVDTTYDANIKTSEETSAWFTYTTNKQIKLSTGEAEKTIYFRVRDKVFNESAIVNDKISLDLSIPVVTMSTIDVDTVSEKVGKDTASFTFSSDTPFIEYKVKVVTATGADHTLGTLIPTTAGSVNTSATGSFNTSVTPISVQIKGTDLKTASAGDAQKIIKVFVKDAAGFWSA
jgi:hypothetical protein